MYRASFLYLIVIKIMHLERYDPKRLATERKRKQKAKGSPVAALDVLEL